MADAEDEIEFEATPEEGEALSLALDGFEGPLALLLDLARAHKVDLAHISVSALADQYLQYIQDHAARMDLAAEYLVMAAWLAYLKSRLIIPHPQITPDEPDPQTLAAALKLKLMRLEEARAAAKRLMQMPQLGRDVFLFGDPKPVAVTRETAWRAELFDLLGAYCREAGKHVRREHKLKPRRVYPLTEARRRLERMLPEIEEWRPIEAVTPPPETGAEAPPPASYLASTFGAALEIAREGKAELKQSEAFAPLFLRGRREPEAAS
ncbi:MAG: segregation/condensation protein A [Alphaproteobacteria bacterium]|nr:segregation/condensation protein A [Alphaproteobacteria bacterium]